MTIYSALPYVKASGLYSLFLPNPANMSFNYFYYLWFILFSYIPGKFGTIIGCFVILHMTERVMLNLILQ